MVGRIAVSYRARCTPLAWTTVMVCGTGRQQATFVDWKIASMEETQGQGAPQGVYEAAWPDMFASLQTAYAELTRAQFELQRRTAEIEVGRDLFLLAVEALRYTTVHNQLHVVQDGVEAMAFLRREGQYVGIPRPDLVLLDLNLPRKDGREVLAEIKLDPDLKRIPVVILTSSAAEQDILHAYNLYANCYITKPLDLEQFLRVIRSIEDFWLAVVKLPPA
jgi:two-component system, chemotaxis family, response regulator Rcp1